MLKHEIQVDTPVYFAKNSIVVIAVAGAPIQGTLHVFNSNGALLSAIKIENEFQNKIEINQSGLASGRYYFLFETAENVYKGKFLIN